MKKLPDNSLTRLIKACCLFLLLNLPLHAADDEIQSLTEINDAVHEFVMSEQGSTEGLSVAVNPLDRRLRLARCDTPLNTSWSPGSRTLGRVTVQVACASSKPWRIHVQSTVTIEGFVWALARAVQRGDILQPDMLVRQSVELGTGNSALMAYGQPIIDVKPWLGFSFTQRVNAGKVLSDRMLRPAKLVHRGEAVLIRHESPGLKLQTKGVALSDASRGSRLQVRNSASGKVIDATAVGKGVVVVLN